MIRMILEVPEKFYNDEIHSDSLREWIEFQKELALSCVVDALECEDYDREWTLYNEEYNDFLIDRAPVIRLNLKGF